MNEEPLVLGLEPPQAIVATASGRGRLLRNLFLLSGSQVATWTLTLAWTLYVPRILGPAGMGLLTLAASASGLLVVGIGLGTRSLLVREIAADPGSASRLLGATFWLRGAFVLPALGLTAAYAALGHFDPAQVEVLAFAAGTAVFAAFTDAIQGALQGIERMGYLGATQVIDKALITLAGIALVVMGQRALAIVALSFAVGALLLGMNIVWLRRHFTIDLAFDLGRLRHLFEESLAYWAFSIFFTFYLWIDAIMLAALTPAEVVGWYGVPTRLFGTLMFIPVILSTAWLPRLAAAFRRDPGELWQEARLPLELVTALGFPVAVGAALVAKPLIAGLYGPAFEPSVPVLAILAIASVPMYMNIVLNQVLIAGGRQALWTRVMAAASVVNLLLNLLLIRHFQATAGNGAIGAASALLLTEMMVVGIGLALLHDLFAWSSLARLLRALAATAGMAVAVLFTARLGLVSEIVAGGLAFVALALLLGVLGRSEMGLAGTMLGRALGRSPDRTRG